MSQAEPLWMLTIIAYPRPTTLLIVASICLAVAWTLRYHGARDTWDQVCTSAVLSIVVFVFGYLTLHVLLGLPVAGLELVQFTH